MVFDTTVAGVAFLVARVLFGGILAFMGVNHFTNAGQMVPYANAKGVPAAGLMVPVSGGLLVVGGLSIITGVYPLIGAGALAVFLLVTTPLMHDFWAVGEEEQQNEMINFLKNVGLFAGSLVFLALAGIQWPYAVGVGL